MTEAVQVRTEVFPSVYQVAWIELISMHMQLNTINDDPPAPESFVALFSRSVMAYEP